jgi:hypothetical protein
MKLKMSSLFAQHAYFPPDSRSSLTGYSDHPRYSRFFLLLKLSHPAQKAPRTIPGVFVPFLVDQQTIPDGNSHRYGWILRQSRVCTYINQFKVRYQDPARYTPVYSDHPV